MANLPLLRFRRSGRAQANRLRARVSQTQTLRDLKTVSDPGSGRVDCSAPSRGCATDRTGGGGASGGSDCAGSASRRTSGGAESAGSGRVVVVSTGTPPDRSVHSVRIGGRGIGSDTCVVRVIVAVSAIVAVVSIITCVSLRQEAVRGERAGANANVGEGICRANR